MSLEEYVPPDDKLPDDPDKRRQLFLASCYADNANNEAKVPMSPEVWKAVRDGIYNYMTGEPETTQ